MEIIKDHEGTEHQQIIIKDIEGDMGEDTRLQLIQQPDGDVVLTLFNTTKGIIDSIEFCSSSGGGRRPIIAQRLRDLIRDLMAGGPPRPTFTQVDPEEASKLWQSGEGMIKNPIKRGAK